MTLALPFLLLWMLGCELIEKAEETDADYGPEVSEEQIELALSKAIHGYSVDGLDEGQLVETVDTRRLENEETVTTLGAARVVVANKEFYDSDANFDYFRFLLQIATSVRLPDETFETKHTEEVLELKRPKDAVAPGFATMKTLDSLSAKLLHASGFVEPADKPVRQTYHNLNQFSEVIEVPPRVKARSGCGGLPNCHMNVRYMQYDSVTWYASGKPFRVHYDYGFSIETPFIPYGTNEEQLAGLAVMLCVSYYVPTENRSVYVRDCKSLDDFNKVPGS